jgi:hypothetical protein
MDSDLPAPPATYAAADAGEMAGAAPGIVGKAWVTRRLSATRM